MAQRELTGLAPQTPLVAESTGVTPFDGVLARRDWSSRLATVLVLALGGIFAYTLPAVWLEDGSSVSLADASTAITFKNAGWVVTLGWFALALAIIAAVVFPRTERFIQAMAVSSGSVAAMVIPYYISTHLTDVEETATGLGTGLVFAWICYGAAATLPWIGLYKWDRATPPLGRDWSKWLFLLPAATWLILLTVFPLVYAFTTSRYVFLYGRINRYVGGDNYKRLFDTESIWRHLGIAIVVAAVAGAIITAVSLLITFAGSREIRRADVRRATGLIPLAAVPAAIVYLTGTILEEQIGEQLNLTYIFVACAVSIEMILGFLIALLMNRELRGRGILRAVITLPIFATPIAIGYLARAIFYEEGGPLNDMLDTFGISPPWLSDPVWARVSTIMVDVWQWTPFVFIIALAGLQGLPQDIVEASEVDGSGGWQVLRYVILPLMAPILWLIFLLRAIDAFKVLESVSGLTLGGPGRATKYYSILNYETARESLRYGDAAAQAFLLLFIVMVLVSLVWGRIRHIYDAEGGHA